MTSSLAKSKQIIGAQF